MEDKYIFKFECTDCKIKGKIKIKSVYIKPNILVCPLCGKYDSFHFVRWEKKNEKHTISN